MRVAEALEEAAAQPAVAAADTSAKGPRPRSEIVRSLKGEGVSLRGKLLSGVALCWYASGFFLPLHLTLWGRDVFLNGYTGVYLIPLFGIYRYHKETDTYQKRRLLWIVALYLLLWVIIPALLGFRQVVPQLGGQYRVFPAIHYVESLTFFLYLLPVFWYGRRADCGWCCPCVAARETIGGAFRQETRKGGGWWWLRYLKWVNVAVVLAYLVAVLAMPKVAHQRYGAALYTYILGFYYLSFLIIPWTGSRNYCRWGCPWGGIWGFVGRMGLNRLVARAERCTACGLCEQVCDMGIPVRRFVQTKGWVASLECTGCGRCIRVCPADVLHFENLWERLRHRQDTHPRPHTTCQRDGPKRPWRRVALMALLIGGGIAALHLSGLAESLHPDNVRALSDRVQELGWVGPAAYVLLWVGACLFFIPGLPITLMGAAVFGTWQGLLWVTLGANLGAMAAFLVGRYGARSLVAAWAHRNPHVERIDRGVARHGWRMVMITRLVPVFPFNLQNYAYGASRIGFGTYTLVTAVCILPASIAYCFAGGAIVSGAGNVKQTLGYLAVAVVFFAVASLIPSWMKRKYTALTSEQ